MYGNLKTIELYKLRCVQTWYSRTLYCNPLVAIALQKAKRILGWKESMDIVIVASHYIWGKSEDTFM